MTTPRNESVSLKEHFEALMLAENNYLTALVTGLEKRYEQGSESDRRGVLVALESINKRLESVNEFRGTINDIISKLLPREEACVKFKSMDDKIEANAKTIAAMSQTLAESAGRGTGYQKSMAVAFSLVGVVCTIGGALAGLFFKK